MNNNDFLKFKEENEKDDSLIINDDFFEQDDLDSDDDQVILNEDKDGECSFFSNNSENELKKFKIISSNINIKDIINNDDNNENIKQENKIENKNVIKNNNILNKEKKEEINELKNNKMNINDDKKEIKIKEEKILNKENKQNIEEIAQIENNIKENNQPTKLNNELQKKSNSKNYFSKKVLYRKNKENKENKEDKENKENKLSKEIINNNITQNNDDEKSKREILTEKRQKSKKSYINKMKEKKNMKINYNNHDKIWKNSSRNEECSKSYIEKGKNDIMPGTEISFDKYGNKIVIKKKDKNNLLNKISKTNQKIIKIEQKLNKSYENNNYSNKKSNINNLSSSKNKCLSNPNSPKIKNKKINKIIVNKSNEVLIRNGSKKSFKDNKNETNAESLKKVLMNKINNQINEIIKGKEKMFFNDNNNLFFLGFCDILFELGFLHIKETEINDISQIKNNLKELYTQPFTNRKLLSENFLFNEQKLLICAWKTILNNFILIKEFDSLPQELEEITLDDCKLFIYIITGLFIGFNQKNLNEVNNNKIKTEIKQIKNKSLSNFRKKNTNKDLINEVKLNQSYTKSFNGKNNKYHFRKKSENGNHKDNHNESNNSNGSSNENILKNILDNRKQSDYNYKSILKIKNFFSYFSELRKLYNLYKKELKSINEKKSAEKELTFYPKTNKNNRILLDKFSPKMDFFQRNALIKKRNEKKIIVLQRERSQKMLKECTFEPCKSNKKIEKIEQLNPKEISERLYHNKNNSKILQKSANLNLKINPDLACKRVEKFYYEKKSKEKFHFKPNINKKFNREMFSNSPLDKDELLNKRIKDLRDANLTRLINNYEKNIRGVLTEEMKKDKNLLLQEIIMEENRNMKLGNEKRTNKDTFDNYQNFNFYNMPNYNYFFNQNEINEPLFTVEIKIKQNIKSIEVYQDNVPEKLAYDFCLENSLGKGSYEKIVNIIKAKLDEIQNGNFNEDIVENNKEDNDKEENNKVNKEKIHEIINQNEPEINENKDKEIIDNNKINDNDINILKNDDQNKIELNEQKDINIIKDEYIGNIDEQHNLSTEEIKQEIQGEEVKQINNLEEEIKI